MASLTWFALLSVFAWAGWRLLRAYFIRHPFDNLPGPRRSSILKGNLGDIFNRHGLPFQESLGRDYGQVVKVHGPLGSRILFVFDPKALNHIVTKDQKVYEEPSWFTDYNNMIFGPGVFSTTGEHHRKQRRLLNPVFSISHMRSVSTIFYETVHRLRLGLLVETGHSGSAEVDMLQWMGRTALELIGQGGLGYSFDPLTKNVMNEFAETIKQVAPAYVSIQSFGVFAPYLKYIPLSVRRLLAAYVPNKQFQRMRTISLALDQHARRVYYSKRDALAKGDEAVLQQMEEKSILSVLVNANIVASEEDRLPEDELVAQIGSLIFAATDTTSNALARTLLLLSEHQDVQDKLRAELKNTTHDGEDIPYDRLVELPYLDAVCRETLRLHAPVNFMERQTVEDIIMPLGEPAQGIDGSMISEVLVPKGSSVIIAIGACNRNKVIWGEDALEWKPERWLKPLPETVVSAHIPGIYANLMTFLGGGRSCIGFKFSQLEMKVVLAVLLRSFRVAPSDKEMYWNLAGINYPTIGSVSTQPAMPLMLYAINE